MKTWKIVLLMVLLWPLTGTSNEQSKNQITTQDFQVLVGEQWEGSLNYRDFSSDRQVSIPVRIIVSDIQNDQVNYRIEYPDEPQYDSDERIIVSGDGTRLNDELVTSKAFAEDGSLVITTQKKGEDNGQAADLRMTYRISPSSFSIQKEVRPESTGDYFTRNTLSLSR